MIGLYLNFGGNAREAAQYYAEAFGGEVTAMMNFDEMPGDDQKEMKGMEPLVIHANVSTFAGQIMMSDTMPGEDPIPSSALWISVSHEDLQKVRDTFDALAKEGEVIMPLGETFFNPLYGQLRDKYGFYWMFMSSEGM